MSALLLVKTLLMRWGVVRLYVWLELVLSLLALELVPRLWVAVLVLVGLQVLLSLLLLFQVG